MSRSLRPGLVGVVGCGAEQVYGYEELIEGLLERWCEGV